MHIEKIKEIISYEIDTGFEIIKLKRMDKVKVIFKEDSDAYWNNRGYDIGFVTCVSNDCLWIDDIQYDFCDIGEIEIIND